MINYKPFDKRTPDTQYQDRLRYIVTNGELVKSTPQGVGAFTCFGTLAPMVFDLSNGVPFITERNVNGFWRKAVGEIIAFINGAYSVGQIEAYGCDFWRAYGTRDAGIGLPLGDLGPGSYGPAFHDYPKPDGTKLNQFKQVLEQIRSFPHMRTHRVTPWIPFYTARGPERKVDVAPCHGELHFRILNGKLHMRMDQRSADIAIGVPSNMIEYAALHLMMCQVTGYTPGNYVHSFSDAHIYENQMEAVCKLLQRDPLPFPILRLDPTVEDLFSFRVEHFTLEEYEPHLAIKIPYSP